jgi:Icc-related predicted phosphoesterase
MKLAVVGDIHVKESDKGIWNEYFERISQEADVLALCGDVTDTGRVEEAITLAGELRYCSIPVLAVLGNHDHEHGHQEEIRQIITEARVQVLEGDYTVIENVGFAGVKGFGGGFDRRMLSMFGEKENKAFVQAAVDESLQLENALSRLDSSYSGLPKIVLLHYSPISATVKGEPEEIWPFLGCSRLAQPIDKLRVDAVFHGHAHLGTLHGETSTGTQVYNVSYPLLKKEGLEAGFLLYEIADKQG